MRILVIGAGVSGLTSLAVLKRARFDVVCVDAASKVGGQWNSAYDTVVLNSSREEYCYPGFPYPPGTPEYPPKDAVLQYWRSFVAHFGLQQYIRLATEVTSMKQMDGARGWSVTLSSVATGKAVQEVFAKVVVATGYAGRAELRKADVSLPGSDVFPGTIAHISDLPTGWMPAPSSTVTVVGFGASAVGLATAYARASKDVHVRHVYRRQNWFIPRYIFGFIPVHRLLFTRAASVMISSWFQSSALERFLQSSAMTFLVYAFWRFLEIVFILSARPPTDMYPPNKLQDSLSSQGLFVLPVGYFDLVRAGRISNHLGSIQQVTETGNVVLSNGTEFKSDYIIMGTGYDPNLAQFIDDTETKAAISQKHLQLYRHMLHPDVPNTAFVGLAAGFLTCTTEYVQACWVAELFAGELELPDRVAMLASMDRLLKLKMVLSPREPHHGIATSGRHYNYIDELLNDLCVDAGRKSSTIAWLLTKTTSADYAGVFDEACAARNVRRHATA